MKRLFSILLAAVLVMACLPVTAFAAEAATVDVSSVTAEPGDEVTISYTVSGEFANYELYITYDSILTLVSIDGVIGNVANGKVAYANSENVASHGFTATFKVSESAAPGQYPVSASVDFVSDRNLVDADVSVNGGVVIIEGEEPPVTEHTHTWSDWAVTKEATCTEAGVETRTCDCGESETREIAALGHTWGEWTASETASCEDDVVWTRTCSVCGEVETKETEGGEHVWGEWQSNYDKTHSRECEVCAAGDEGSCEDHAKLIKEDGNVKTYRCELCGYEWTEGENKPPVDDPNLDDVPKTGDITPQITMTVAGVIAMMAAVAFVFKRKAAK